MKVLNLIIISIIISLIIIIIVSIISQCKEFYLKDDPILHVLKHDLEPVHPIIKQLSLYVGNKSYTINKEKVFMCLKNENKKYYDKNTLYYVLLHEVAHVLNDEIGHTDKFNKIFDELLDKATQLGLYNPNVPIPENYCSF